MALGRCGPQCVCRFDALARVQGQLLAAGHGVIHRLALFVHDLQQWLARGGLQPRHQGLDAGLGLVRKALVEGKGVLAVLRIMRAHEL